MRDLKAIGTTAAVASLEELQALLQPFAGTVVEQYLDNPNYPETSLTGVTLGEAERGDLDFDPGFRYLHLNAYYDPPDQNAFIAFCFDRTRLPILREIEGGKVLIEEPEAVCHLLVPLSPQLRSKLSSISE